MNRTFVCCIMLFISRVSGSDFREGTPLYSEARQLAIIGRVCNWDENSLPKWISGSSDTIKNPCDSDMEGIVCDNNRVTSIAFPDWNVNCDFSELRCGSVDMSVFSLLESIDFRNNPSVSGTIPCDFAGASALRRLDFTSTTISGNLHDFAWSKVPMLNSLWLAGASISGTFPTSLASVETLAYVDISGNGVSGTLPEQLAELEYLTRFIASENSISGSIPGFGAANSFLSQLVLDQNSLSGSIPASIGSAGSAGNGFEVFHIQDNAISGDVAPSTLGTRLTSINLANNAFTGLTPHLHLHPRLTTDTVDLSLNTWSCPIPTLHDVYDSAKCTCFAGFWGSSGSDICSWGSSNAHAGDVIVEKHGIVAGGAWMNTSSRFNCSGCAAGKFSAADWSLDCDDCNPGTYSAAAASSCSACTAGTYSTASEATSCIECSDGMYTDGMNGHTVCQSCGRGTFSNANVGHDGCELCAKGHSSNLTEQSACPNCPSGRYTPVEGSVECLHCAQGHHSVVNSTDCVKCTEGKYAAELDSAQCEDSTLGHFLVGCEPGTFDGCVRSVPCQAGRYASELHITSCTACSAGSFSLEGSSICTACPEGKYSTDFPSTASCKSASIGYYVPGSSATEQLPCPVGHGTNVKGMTSCPECPPGSVSWRQGSPCSQCEPGKFQEESGKSECHPCARGAFSVAGATACTTCTHSSITNITVRRQCMLEKKPDAPKAPPSDTTLAFEVIGIGVVGSVLIGAIAVAMVGGFIWYRSHMSASGRAIKDTINTTADGVLHQEGEWSELKNEAGKFWYYNARTDEVTYTKPY